MAKKSKVLEKKQEGAWTRQKQEIKERKKKIQNITPEIIFSKEQKRKPKQIIKLHTQRGNPVTNQIKTETKWELRGFEKQIKGEHKSKNKREREGEPAATNGGDTDDGTMGARRSSAKYKYRIINVFHWK